MKIEKLVNTIVFVVIGILIIQIFLEASVLILCGDTNISIGIIISILIVLSGIILVLFLSKLFEAFTKRNFGEEYYKFYSFDKSKNLYGSDDIRNPKQKS